MFKHTKVLVCSVVGDFGKGGREGGFLLRFAVNWSLFCPSAMAQLCSGKGLEQEALQGFELCFSST